MTAVCVLCLTLLTIRIIAELRCLQTILADQSKALDADCKQKLEKRMEMYSNAAPVSESVTI